MCPGTVDKEFRKPAILLLTIEHKFVLVTYIACTITQYSIRTTCVEIYKYFEVKLSYFSVLLQRKDYTCLTKLLPPKHEYVLSVRLSELQMKLYEVYLKLNMPTESNPYHCTSLFSDYQCLMRIWTHPWVLKLDEIRQEKKVRVCVL